MSHGPLFFIGAHHVHFRHDQQYTQAQRAMIDNFINHLSTPEHELLKLTVGTRRHMCAIGIVTRLYTRQFHHPDRSALGTKLVALLRRLEDPA